MGIFSSFFSGFSKLGESSALFNKVVAVLLTRDAIELSSLPGAAQKGVMDIVYKHYYSGETDVDYLANHSRLWLVSEGYI